jgi:UPF0755 protein
VTQKSGRARSRRSAPRTRRPGRTARPAVAASLLKNRRLLLAIAAVPVLAVVWAAWLFAGPGPRSADGRPTDVVLPVGARLPAIAASLAHAHVVASGLAFIAAAELTRAAPRLQAGEYEIPSGASMSRVLAMIRDGLIVRHFVTVPEGVAAKAVVDILERSDVLTGEAPAPPEGSVLPETYQVLRGETRAQVLARMMQARDKLLAQLWNERVAGLPYDDPEQAVTLASIVEKETAQPDERGRIAGLFINRLRAGMRLESDPTVIYGLTSGTPLGHPLFTSELVSRTPYNTYLVTGLPPTPIANPGRASLEAALHPAQTGDLYFVADGTGGHVFAATWADHLKNVAHWRAIEKARAGATPQ